MTTELLLPAAAAVPAADCGLPMKGARGVEIDALTGARPGVILRSRP
jgi:hypothetical protein